MYADEDPREVAERVLEPGENLVWAGRPDPLCLLRFAPAIVFMVFVMVFAWSFTTSFVRTALRDQLLAGRLLQKPVAAAEYFGVVGLGGLVIATILVSLAAGTWLLVRRTLFSVYAFSERRALLIYGVKDGNATVWSLPGEVVSGIQVHERSFELGDVVFEHVEVGSAAEHRRRPDRTGFFRIPNVCEVEQLLRETFHQTDSR